MGTYNNSADEIADAFEEADVDSHIEGDFYFEDFILGAIVYIERLKKKGMSCYSEKKKEIKKFKEELKK